MAEAAACITVPVAGVVLILVIIAFAKIRNLRLRMDAETNTLYQSINQLTSQLNDLKGGAAAPTKPVSSYEQRMAAQRTSQAKASPTSATISQKPVEKATPIASASSQTATSVRGISSVESSARTWGDTAQTDPQRAEPARQPAYRKAAEELRENPIVSWFSGTHIVVRVGIIVLFFGVAFLLKFAADMGWLSIELRLAGAAVIGLALVGFGYRLRNSEERSVYSLTLQGGGLGILYMTTFTAFRIYSLLPAPLAFGLLVVVSAATVGLAVANDSRTLAIISVVGGFAAPFLVSTGEGSHIMLFSYVAVINLVILAVAWFKAWRELNLVGFVATIAVAVLWGTQAYAASLLRSTEVFLALFFLFYVAVAMLHSLRRPMRFSDPVDGVLVFGTPVATVTFQLLMLQGLDTDMTRFVMAWMALAMGLVYLVTGAVLWRVRRESFLTIAQIFYGWGAFFVMFAVPFAFTAELTAAVWAAAGAGLLWLGAKYAKGYYRLLGVVTQFAAGVAMVIYLYGLGWSTNDAGYDAFTFVGPILALTGLFSGYAYLRASALSSVEQRLGQYALTIWGLVWWFGWGVRHVDRWLSIASESSARFTVSSDMIPATLLLFFVLSAALAEWLGRRLDWSLLRFVALLIPIPAGVAMMALIVDSGHALGDGGWLAWPVTFAVYYWMLYRRDGDGWQQVYHAVGLWALAIIGVSEGAYLVDTILSEAYVYTTAHEFWRLIGFVCVPIILVYGISLLGRTIRWPTGRHYRTYMTLGLGPIVALLLGWVVVTTFSSDGTSTLRYVAIVNPLSLTQLLILAATAIWLRRLELDRDRLITGYAVIAAFVFLWLTAEMARVVHHYRDVPYEVSALLNSELLQTSYSIVWTGLALVIMFAAKHWKARWAWLVGVSLLGVTVLKLFFIDLSNTGTLARIISFLVVGILMLVIGYLAPIPPRDRSDEIDDCVDDELDLEENVEMASIVQQSD